MRSTQSRQLRRSTHDFMHELHIILGEDSESSSDSDSESSDGGGDAQQSF